MTAAFSPRRLLANAHVQTFFAGLPVLFATPADALRRHVRIPLPGDEALHAISLFHPDGKRSVALLVHGLGGSTKSAYLQRAARAIYTAGYHVVCLDLRGVGEGATWARSLYHAGLASDLSAAVAHVLLDRRVSDLVLVGFSLGGQTSLFTAAEWGANAPAGVRAVISLCAPLDLAATSRKIERLRARPYLRHVMGGLVEGAIALRRRAPEKMAVTEAELARLTTVREYDERVIAPMHGFASADAYYAACSSGPRLGEIRVPTHLIATDDDPMVPAETVRPWLERASPQVRVTMSARGGHLGFVSELGDGVWKTWANQRVIEILAGRA